MSSEQADPPIEPAGLEEPPRDVAFRLRCRLLAGPVVLIASGIFAFAMTFAIMLSAGASPVTDLMLRLNRREAPGRLEAVKPTNFSEGDEGGGEKILRYEFSFESPSGERIRGRSYATHLPVKLPKGRLEPNRPADLVIEYHPDHPARNRIQSARVSPFGSLGLVVLLLPIIPILVVVGGIFSGRRKVRLLRNGTPARATMIACVTTGENSVEMPLAEYKRTMASIRFPGMGAFLAFAQGFRLVWLLGLAGIFIFGMVVVVGGLIFLLVMLPKHPEVLPMLFGILGFGALWVTMCVFMMRAGGAGRLGRKATNSWQVKCVFEFRPAGGELEKVNGEATVHPDSADEPPQLVLYDPANPKHAALISGIVPGLTVSPSGGWEAPGGLLALLRLTAIVLLIAGPILTWIFMPSADP